MNLMVEVGMIIVVFGLISFMLMYGHSLMMLLNIEFMMLGVFIFIMEFIVMFSGEFYLVFVFLVFMVCESVLGLSIIVLLSRFGDNDFFLGLSFLSC